MGFKNSVQHAAQGLVRATKTEPNVRWQLLAIFVVVVLGCTVQLSRGEWLIIVVVSGLVLAMELVNTSVEKILDIVKPRLNEQVGLVKDIMAGAVLTVSVVALLSGILIFWPYLFRV